MDTEKRLLLVLIFSILAVVFYQRFILHPKKGKNQAQPTKVVKATQKPVNSPKVSTHEADSLPLRVQPVKGKDREIQFSFPSYRVVLSSKGGTVKSYLLTRYTNDKGKPMELVGGPGYFRYYIPGEITLTKVLNDSIYKVEVQEGKQEKRVTFLLDLPKDGIRVEKTYIFHPDYRFDVAFKALLPGHREAEGVLIGPKIAPNDRKSRYSFSGPLVFNGKKAIEVKLKKKDRESYKNFLWTSLQSLYFTATLVPKTPCQVLIWKGLTKGDYYLALLGKKGQISFWSFMGPKDYSLLKSYGVKLEENIRFGIFKVIAKPALEALKFINRYTHNYGWAIIIITILIKIVFHPLTVKGYRSMNKMQELQPYIKQLKKTYKDDPGAVNREMMALYKKHKVNPMGGCLPMLLQIPVFFALYKVLMVAIELRHAPFIFWITDLSAKDPYYITPILMGLSMFIQQKMTPMGDPTQAKMMLLMPIVFTFLFINFPSGLVIYWLVNNLITILEQFLIKKVYA